MPVSISSAVLPEMREYERTITTVANAYVQPQVARYVANLGGEDRRRRRGRPALASCAATAACRRPRAPRPSPVNLLLSGPAGGVTGATWVAEQAGFHDFLTFDMGGTSTDVALVQNLRPADRPRDQGRRPGRPLGLGGRADGRRGRRIHRARARADPRAAGRPAVRRRRARAPPPTAAAARSRPSPTPTWSSATCRPGWPAARSTSTGTGARQAVQQDRRRHGPAVGRGRGPGHRRHRQREHVRRAAPGLASSRATTPRDFALVAFGGAGPLHANALGRLTGSWPVIIPPSPGVLCAYGDATTCLRDEAARTYIRRFSQLTDAELARTAHRAGRDGAATLRGRGHPTGPRRSCYQVDVRYHGQGFEIPITVDPDTGLEALGERVRRRARTALLLPARQRARAGQRPGDGQRPAPQRPADRSWSEATADASSRRPGSHEVWIDGRLDRAPPSTTGRRCARDQWSPAPRSSSRWTPPP